MAEDLIREELHDGRKVYICSCGLGYDDMLIAYACDEYVQTHGISSEDITKRAVYNLRSNRATKRALTTP
jgi:protein-tyrosine-phosphatase